MVNGWLVVKNFVFGGNYFVRGEFVLYINHSGKYIEINFNMKISFSYIFSTIARITLFICIGSLFCIMN